MNYKCFNPAEAEEGFSSVIDLPITLQNLWFQSSRSRRRV